MLQKSGPLEGLLNGYQESNIMASGRLLLEKETKAKPGNWLYLQLPSCKFYLAPHAMYLIVASYNFLNLIFLIFLNMFSIVHIYIIYSNV